MHEINIVVGRDALEDRIVAKRRELVPAHVGNRPPLSRLEAPDLVGEYAETVSITFLRALEEQLHAEADAKNGLSERRQQVCDTILAQPGHGVRGGSNARQDDAWG